MAPPGGSDGAPTSEPLGADAFSRHGHDLGNKKSQKSTMAEMKRINALNLEPTLPRAEDAGRNRNFTFKESAGRTTQRNDNLKQEFEKSLQTITSRQSAAKNRQQKSGQASSDVGDSGPGKKPFNNFQPVDKRGSGMLNPNAADFTPTAGAASAGGGSGKSGQPNPTFTMKTNHDLVSRRLDDIFDPFFRLAKDTAPDQNAPIWPGANGPSYHEFLGKVDPASQPIPLGGAAHGGNSAAGAPPQMSQWQQQSQQQQSQQQPQQPPQQHQQQPPPQHQPHPQPGPPQQPQQPQQQQQQGPPLMDQNPMGGPLGPGGVPQMMPGGYMVANPQSGAQMQMFPQMQYMHGMNPQAMGTQQGGNGIGQQPNPQQPSGPQQGPPQQGNQQQNQQQPNNMFMQQMMMPTQGMPGQQPQTMVPVGMVNPNQNMVAPSQGGTAGGQSMMSLPMNFPGAQQGQVMMVPMMMAGGPGQQGFMPQQNFMPQPVMQGQPGQMMQQPMYNHQNNTGG